MLPPVDFCAPEGRTVAYDGRMRDFLLFLLFLAVIFFVVGEWRGWHLGVPAQTPVMVYKSTSTARATRRTINRDQMPVGVSGRVRNGEVTLRVIYRDTGSFQTNTAGREPEEVFEETFRMGQVIGLNEVFDEGRGEYQIVLEFRDATGVFGVDLPTSSEL